MMARRLYPTAATLEGWTTVDDARTWSGVSPASWDWLMNKAGAGDAPIVVVVALPVHGIVDLIRSWSEELRPAYAEQVKVALTFNAIRLMFELELADLLPPPASATVILPTAPSAPTAVLATTGVKIKLSQIIDQGSDQEILILDHVALTRFRTRFNDLNGDSPLQKVEVTDAQLSALDFRVTSGQAPFADFGVWGPYGARLERRLKFTHHVMGPDGTWKTMELPGADSLHTWRSCWSVFRTASIMVGLAHPAVLDRYEALFVDRCERYPRCWHICARADIRCRMEWWTDERRRQESFHAHHPTLSGYDPNMPWNSVIKASASDVEFWDRELKEPSLLYTMGHGKTHPTHVTPLLEPEGGVDPPRKPKRPRGGRGKGKQQEPNKVAKGKGKGRKGQPVRNRDGKYNTDRAGKQLCYAWNRTAGGCTTGQCPAGRSHLCEECLQPHRCIDCPLKSSKGGAEVHT